jgi:hypothetical protein
MPAHDRQHRGDAAKADDSRAAKDRRDALLRSNRRVRAVVQNECERHKLPFEERSAVSSQRSDKERCNVVLSHSLRIGLPRSEEGVEPQRHDGHDVKDCSVRTIEFSGQRTDARSRGAVSKTRARTEAAVLVPNTVYGSNRMSGEAP